MAEAPGARPPAAAAAPPAATASFFGGAPKRTSGRTGSVPRTAANDASRADALRVTSAIFEDGISLHRAGDADGALRLFEQALASYRRYLKPGDPLIVKTLNNIAAT